MRRGEKANENKLAMIMMMMMIQINKWKVRSFEERKRDENGWRMLNNVRCDSTLSSLELTQQLSRHHHVVMPNILVALQHSTTYFICVIARRAGRKKICSSFYRSKLSLVSLPHLAVKTMNALIVIINKLFSLCVFTPPLVYSLLDGKLAFVFLDLWPFKGQR